MHKPQQKQKPLPPYYSNMCVYCAGTIWRLSGCLEGTDDGIAALQAHGKRLVYLSNNAVRSADGYESKFIESNIQATFVSSDNQGLA